MYLGFTNTEILTAGSHEVTFSSVSQLLRDITNLSAPGGRRERPSRKCTFTSLFKAPKGNLLKRVLFEVSWSFLGCIAVFCRFLLQAKLSFFNEIQQNVNDLIFTDKVE